MEEFQEIVIRRRKGWIPLSLRELWEFRDLLYFLSWRDIKVKYKQAALGAAWAVLQPLLSMVVFTVIFGRLAHVPSDGIPYPLFVYSGLLIWNYFSSALSASGNSLVLSSQLVTKVYFPRLMIPLSACVSGILDFMISSVFFVVMLFFFHAVPSLSDILLVPLLLAIIFVVTVGFGLWLSALNVEYRDFQYIIPFMIQFLMFATPVIYPLTLFPARYHLFLSLNPLCGVIETFRAVLFGTCPVRWELLLVSSGTGLLIFFTGLLYFRRVERSFADVI
jgi:lipopolysaccharide transport system permease protein